jgi:hypothetical protein
VYQQILAVEPQLFWPPGQALPWVGLGILERVSSMLIHFSWGYLALTAACFRRRSLLLIALPMGLVDSLVPFAGALSAPIFEGIVFASACACLILALESTRSLRKKSSGPGCP